MTKDQDDIKTKRPKKKDKQKDTYNKYGKYTTKGLRIMIYKQEAPSHDNKNGNKK